MRRLSMQIELTNHCNFKCVYCPHDVYGEDAGPSGNPFNRPKGFMAPELFAKAIKGACDHARSLTMGFFGEQQLHKQFREFIQSVPKKHGFQFILNSNWSRVTEEDIDTLNCFDSIRISLDSTDAAKWEKLCPGGPVLTHDGKNEGNRYQALVDKIRWWLALPHRAKTHIIFVTQDENSAEAKRFGNEWAQLMRKGDQVVTKSIITYGGVVFDPYMKVHACKVAQEGRFTVAWDGRCTPCNLDVNLAMSVLNLNTHTVPEIVASPEWEGMLDGIRKKRGICANCFDAQNHSQKYYRPAPV